MPWPDLSSRPSSEPGHTVLQEPEENIENQLTNEIMFIKKLTKTEVKLVLNHCTKNTTLQMKCEKKPN